jgi:large subunit ribosomal protein L6
VTVTGPKGTLSRSLHPDITVSREDGTLVVTRPTEQKTHKQLHGLTRTLVNNMVVGVTDGYRKGLEITGVGYRATLNGKKLTLNLGYSHPIEIDPPEGISFEVENPTRLAVVGIDKELVGQIAAKVRATRKPEPYKGKGVRYAGEYIRRKAGKAGKIGGKK